ncbi:hypothetical protein M0E87_06785 [Corynebacterium sp. CCM 9185]|uniref:Uncharacterized protein n=1 Tax=Corynebacterium marambiense TaxID=2765364 RepID=A0ABS0VTB2_9CORY|nr:DUF6882 domain-containing protein [Corynebacterium marambiense]MBI9000013.1 hypothetical protein [Corynebacterium marambiense]MCK7663365.1 hypothetical protein [Corynebacterium marambiense]
MEHPAPRTLAEIVADGAIACADADAAFVSSLRDTKGIDFNRAGDRMEVHAARHGAPDLATTGTIVAEIRDGIWTWCSDIVADAATRFEIPELSGPQAPSDELLAAARTLHGCTPGLLAPMSDGTTAVVCLDPPQPFGDTRTALITAAGTPGATDDIDRALSGFAAIRGLGVRVDGSVWHFSDGASARVENGRLRDIAGGLDIDQVRSDALLNSIESQMYLDAVFPGAAVTVDLEAGRITLRTPDGVVAPVQGTVLATVTGDTWCWGWADRNISATPGTTDCHQVREFGRREGIPVLVAPTLPLPLARELDLVSAAKPVLDKWFHSTVQFTADTWAIVVFTNRDLVLPPPTTAAVTAVINTIRGADLGGIDASRAVAAYARFRNLGIRATPDSRDSVSLQTQDGTVTVRFSADGGVLNATTG